MKNRNFWVIDADIARSAGKTIHPWSKNCREFLEIISDNKKIVSMNQKLIDEWKKHASIFSITWLSNMRSQRRVKDTSGSIIYSSTIEIMPISDDQKKIANKDSHLIDIALEVEKNVASADDKARRVFVIISENRNELKDLLWINPRENASEINDYIVKNKTAKPEWFLGYHE